MLHQGVRTPCLHSALSNEWLILASLSWAMLLRYLCQQVTSLSLSLVCMSSWLGAQQTRQLCYKYIHVLFGLDMVLSVQLLFVALCCSNHETYITGHHIFRGCLL